MSQSQDSVSSNQQEAHSTSLAGRIGLFLGPVFMLVVLVLPAPAGMDAGPNPAAANPAAGHSQDTTRTARCCPLPGGTMQCSAVLLSHRVSSHGVRPTSTWRWCSPNSPKLSPRTRTTVPPPRGPCAGSTELTGTV